MTPVMRALLDCLPHAPGYTWNWAGLEGMAPLSDWLRRMAQTPQNPLWHGEGDVWAHTRLACEALASLPDFRAMPPRIRDALALAALLHDIGKVKTTKLEDCTDGPYPFGSPRTQRALFKGSSVWRDQALFDESWGEVILMCGLPGTGKDAWIRAKCPGLPVVSLDDVRLELDVTPTQSQGQVVQAARERARALLRQRQPFVWNATSLTALRAQQVGLFEDYGARVRVVFLETAWDENLRRNAGRRDAVPEDVIDGMLARLEPPERWEAQAVEWLCV